MKQLVISEVFGPTVLPERVWSRLIVTESGCWEWTGARNKAGYGQVWWQGRQVSVHRLIYEVLIGPVGKPQLDHFECDNPPCSNPAHLRPATARENTLRSAKAPAAVNARKRRCRKGHSLRDAYMRKDGRRRCRTCDQDRSRAYQRAKAAAKKEVVPHG